MTPVETPAVHPAPGIVPRPPWHENLVARYRSLRNGVKPSLIVLHDTAGSGTHNDTRYLADSGDVRKVSSDFTVERSGAIYKLNPQLRIYCTWHAGNLTRWHALRDGAINRYSIGIEICQPARQEPVNPYPFEQVRAVAWLCAWLSQEFKIDRAAITTHRDLSYTGRRSDPRRFPFEGPSGFNAQYHGFRGFALEVAMGEEEHEDGDTLTA